MLFASILFLISICAGFIGSLLGLGGGIIVVPFVTLVFGIDIRYAIAASLISVIATSAGAASTFLKAHLANLRLALMLELGTVAGAMSGFFLSGYLPTKYLFIIFGGFLLFSALMMFRKKQDTRAEVNHPWAEKLKLNGSWKEGNEVHYYKVENVPAGLVSMYAAGIVSSLLGIGSGIFKVMAMDGAMKLPIKVSTATSNFMIGVTAAASAGAFFFRGDIKPEIAAPVALGIIIGSRIGAHVMPKVNANLLRNFFIIIMIAVSVQMIMKGWRL